ncbi:MAG: PBP1A family penicillin-binding protein [Oligoflexales bacterium]|nr:PBP1A family penicillin-binding protein [Oligoflexales bacterium]
MNPTPFQDTTPISTLKSKYRKFVYVGFLALSAIVGLVFGIVLYKFNQLGFFSEFEEETHFLKNYEYSDNTIIYDRHGKVITEVYSKRHSFMSIENIPPTLIDAVIAIEDKNYFSHHGIDYISILRAVTANLNSYIKSAKYSQGASTITQQLVRYNFLSREKSIFRKMKEIFISWKVEEKLSKNEILELYLNTLFLGHNSYGVGSASLTYFNKDLSSLELHELAFLAGLFQAPSRYNPIRNEKLSIQRQRSVLKAMHKNNFITKEQLFAAAKKALVFKISNPKANQNSHVSSYVIDSAIKLLPHRDIKNKGLKIYTTLDLNIQNQIDESLAKYEGKIKEIEGKILPEEKGKVTENRNFKKPRIEVAAITLETKSGAIVNLIGGRDFKLSQFNRAINSRRASGSAFKPIVYSLALERGRKWSDVYYVSPLNFKGYRPKNFDSEYLTETTLLRAFYKSLNTPTVELANQLGITRIIEHAQKLGVTSPLKTELGVALGSSDISVLDLARAYSVFANDGYLIEPNIIERITDKQGEVLFQAPPLESRRKQVIDNSVAFLMHQGLKSVFDYGTASAYKYLHPNSVGKTGTSNSARDNWFCGYDTNYITIVWLGIENGGELPASISSSSVALPLWSQFMKLLASNNPSLSPKEIPNNVISTKVNPRFGYADNNGINMWFLGDKAPNLEQNNAFKKVSKSSSFRRGFD